jgi:hypothetical protein
MSFFKYFVWSGCDINVMPTHVVYAADFLKSNFNFFVDQTLLVDLNLFNGFNHNNSFIEIKISSQ